MSESKIEEIKEYYYNGKLEQHYHRKYGKIHGEFKQWYKNGQIWEHSFYNNGKFHGEFKYWYSNGQIWEHSFRKNGKFHGEFKQWYNNGQILTHAFYNNGNRLNEYTWDCLVKVQKSYRIKYNLKKYFGSKAFVEWWYHPDMPGGKAAKKDLESFVDSL